MLKKAADLRKKLNVLWCSPPTAENEKMVQQHSRELDEILLREEIMWKLWSRATYLKCGNRNTKWFQRKATWWKKKNEITKLKKSQGEWVDNKEGIHGMTNAFLQDLYKRENGTVPREILDLVAKRVTPDMNSLLTKHFSPEEVSATLFQIGPLKAMGIDGFPARLYQKNLETIKGDVTKAVLSFFDDGIMPEGINDTVIVLIPKGKDPQSLKEFRPISLCNMIYKVISKCLVSRLRPILDDIISDTQSVFIPGRMITDNAIIAFECFHKIQNVRAGHDSHCAYKLDLAKAYDHVD